MFSRKCECCGRVFLSKSKVKMYCSRVCAREMTQRKREEYGQLCWLCKNACGGCDWSRNFKPIEGWKAKPTLIYDSAGSFESYRIKECPEFTKL